jgi:hypothetical protein
MGMKQLEAAILVGAKIVFHNSKLRQKDIREWSTGKVKPQDGEVVAHIPDPEVYVAILKEHDKR